MTSLLQSSLIVLGVDIFSNLSNTVMNLPVDSATKKINSWGLDTFRNVTKTLRIMIPPSRMSIFALLSEQMLYSQVTRDGWAGSHDLFLRCSK